MRIAQSGVSRLKYNKASVLVELTQVTGRGQKRDRISRSDCIQYLIKSRGYRHTDNVICVSALQLLVSLLSQYHNPILLLSSIEQID